uniref:Apolipoprotein A-IV a n=1 Tax=Amphiprion ocellaris TaxID=80972 RepID=A0A3Q1ANQ3_AMPOC
MKVLVVLVIAVFTAGCNANIEFQTPSKQQLDMVKDAFWDYVAKATATAEDSLKQIRESELGRDVCRLVKVILLLCSSLITSQDLVSTFSQEADKLKARVEKDLQPYAQEMLEMLQAKLEELKKEVETADTEALKELLLQRSQELKLQLDQSVEQLQTKMVPYAEEMKQKLDQSVEQLQTRMVPYAEEMKQKSFEVHVAQKAQEVRQQLAPYEEELKAKLTSENLKAQLRALWDAFSKLGQ